MEIFDTSIFSIWEAQQHTQSYPHDNLFDFKNCYDVGQSKNHQNTEVSPEKSWLSRVSLVDSSPEWPNNPLAWMSWPGRLKEDISV